MALLDNKGKRSSSALQKPGWSNRLAPGEVARRKQDYLLGAGPTGAKHNHTIRRHRM